MSSSLTSAALYGTANKSDTPTLTSGALLTTFSKFPKLPPELRLKIWGYAAWVPLIIGIRDEQTSGTVEGTTARCHLIMTCKEARSEVLRSRQDLHASQSRSHAKIFFNPDIDILWITDSTTTPRQLKKFRSSIKRLAVNNRLWYGSPDTEVNDAFLPRHLLMLDVQEVIVVVKSELIKENDTPVFIQPREGPNPDEHTRTLTSANNAILWGGSRVQKNTWDERVIQERDDLKAMLIIYNLVVAMLRESNFTTQRIEDAGYRVLLDWKVPDIKFREVVTTSSL